MDSLQNNHIIPDNYWAKLEHARDDDGNKIIIDWMPIDYHLIDVATVFEVLLDVGGFSKSLAASTGLCDLSHIQRNRLCILAFLHDIGKLNAGFQRNMYRGNASVKQSLLRGHQKEACSFLCKYMADKVSKEFFLQSFNIDGMINWFETELPGKLDYSQLEKLLIAAWMHHGWQNPDSIASIRRDMDLYRSVTWDAKDIGSDIPYLDFQKIVTELRDSAMAHWGSAYDCDDTPLDARPDFMREFNGVLNLADWIGSDQNMFVFHHNTEKYATRYEFAKETAINFINNSGLVKKPKNSEFKSIFGFNRNSIQQSVFEITNDI